MNEKNFLERIRSADDRTKKRWMIIFTVISMIVVIYVWLAYFNNLISGFSSSGREEAQDDGFTFWQAIRGGGAIIYGGFTEKARGLGDVLNAPREYIIEPPR